jgi:hypothetical protein
MTKAEIQFKKALRNQLAGKPLTKRDRKILIVWAENEIKEWVRFIKELKEII